jgi:hypothetical protein
MADSTGKFPSPYLNDVRAEDPIMKRVPMATMDIGARKSGMPSSGPHSEATISHVGDTASSKSR